MSSSSNTEAIRSTFLESLRSGHGLSALVPNPSQTTDQEGVGEGGSLSPSDAQLRERISRFFVQTRRDLQNLLRRLPVKSGLLPASKASIEAMPMVEVAAGSADCSICLEDLATAGGGGGAKEMPCKHLFHSDCIEKWLGIRRSCPECRYQMPVDEEEQKEKDDASDDGGEEMEGGGARGEIRVRIVIGEYRRESSAPEVADEAEEEDREEEEEEEEESDGALDMEF